MNEPLLPDGLESGSCPLGCPKKDQPVLSGRDRLYGLPGQFRVVRCEACGLLRTDPRPTPQAMRAYYPDDYGPYVGTRIATRTAPRALWRRSAAAVVRRLFDSGAESLPRLAPGRMLEIGCASGDFLDRMARRGWQVEGIEPSQAAAAEAQRLGHTVHVGTLETVPVGLGPFDMVVGWMVIEHLHDPVHGLRRLRNWTRPGGSLVLSVPNAAGYELGLFKDRWYALHLPHHLWHPTPASLRAVLHRGGWSLEKIIYHRDLRNVFGSLGYVLRDYGIGSRLADWLGRYPLRGGLLQLALHPLAAALALIGQTGRMTVWARRRDESA